MTTTTLDSLEASSTGGALRASFSLLLKDSCSSRALLAVISSLMTLKSRSRCALDLLMMRRRSRIRLKECGMTDFWPSTARSLRSKASRRCSSASGLSRLASALEVQYSFM